MKLLCKTLTALFLLMPHLVEGQNFRAALTPSPISIAISIGQWMMKEDRKVFYVQVEATANGKEEARSEAFRLAVEMAVGALVVSETEVKNAELVRKEIIKYSSGFVDNFIVKSESQVGNKTRLVIDVWVGESKIADRLVNVSKAEGVIDGARAAAQQESIANEKNSAARLIELVVKDYPRRAFDIKVGKITTRVEPKKIAIIVPVAMKWNNKYLESLIEVLDRTKDGSDSIEYGSRRRKFVVAYRKIDGWLTYYVSYNDPKPRDILLHYFFESKPQLRINFRDNDNNVLAVNCRQIDPLSGTYYGDAKMIIGSHTLELPTGQFISNGTPTSHIGIYGDYRVVGNLPTEFQNNTELLAKFTKVDVEIVTKNDCDEDNYEEMSQRLDVQAWCRAHHGNGKKYCPIDTR
jgi:hypothetical protein